MSDAEIKDSFADAGLTAEELEQVLRISTTQQLVAEPEYFERPPQLSFDMIIQRSLPPSLAHITDAETL